MSADGVALSATSALAPAAAPAVWLWDSQRRRIVWANAEALALFGAPDSASLGMRALPDVEAAIAATAAGAGSAEAALRGALGVCPGRLAAWRAALPDGRFGLRVEFRAEPRLVEDEALKAAAFAASPCPAAVADGSGAILVANRAFHEAFGPGPRRLDPAALAAGAGALRASDGGAMPFRATPLGAPALGADLALVAAEPARAEPGAVTAAALARVAHEFRSPLTAVLGFAEFLREHAETAPPARLRAYLDDLSAAADRVRRLADDLVTIGAAGARLRLDVVALDPLVAEALRLSAPAAAARGVRLEPPEQTGLQALADAGALGRALLNLVDNAVRHGRPGGRVAVAVGTLDRGPTLSVVDDGPGLDEAGLAEAMRPFGRPNGGAGQGGPAGGLGLPIARETAEAHGGRLEIETAPGRGFLARIVLPPACLVRGRSAPPR